MHDAGRESFDPWRRLAAAVIERAIKDAGGDHPKQRREAQRWIAGPDLTAFLAGVNCDPVSVRYALRRRGLLPAK